MQDLEERNGYLLSHKLTKELIPPSHPLGRIGAQPDQALNHLNLTVWDLQASEDQPSAPTSHCLWCDWEAVPAPQPRILSVQGLVKSALAEEDEFPTVTKQ